ncbi:methyl-accepting chemotaxis protein [Rugamonas rubra]|uniref:Methyl-accepting chemotaxis protein n=1 Tax=Rugamonas rubra TaxID=758825 RepID=A0A1I4QKB0_9BURK|nr:methyl-accepting chemotaxis protein [Rugamonas rubra]SFM40120.1 Methyl-accepting chemotaxis protein [Rugamonas rubra]
MKQLVDRILSLSVWTPGSRLMRRLRFPGKFSLISLGFMVPLLWLLCVYHTAAMQDLRVVRLERTGLRFVQPLYQAREAAIGWRLLARNAAQGEAAEGLAERRQAFEAAYRRVDGYAAAADNPLGATAEMAALREAYRAAQAGFASADEAYQKLSALDLALARLADNVTDSSGLALDPNLATYRLMSATLLHGPQVIRQMSELRSLGRAALKTGSIDAQQGALLQRRLAVAEHEQALALADLALVARAAPEHAQVRRGEVESAVAAVFATLRSTFPPGQSELAADRAAFGAQLNAAIALQFGEVGQNLAILDRMLAERESALLRALYSTLALCLLGVLLAAYLCVGFYQSMLSGFKRVRHELIAISMGDLRAEIDDAGRDELAGLLRELGNMQKALRDTVQQVQQASDHVVASSIGIAQGTRELSARTESAASALEQSSAALEQTTSTVQMTADAVRQASAISIANAATATRGGQVMHTVVATMEGIEASSKQIGEIIGVIDGIAFQTNILALNAAVEAARAGEQGRGFAVVATEVRALAGRSADAARQVKELITRSSREVRAGTEVVRQAGQAIGEIVENAAHIKSLLDDVANGAREQSAGIGQIGAAVAELDRDTQANALLVEQTAAAAGTQREVAVRLAAQVDEFRLPGQRAAALVEGIDVDGIIDAHRQWKVKLRDAIEQGGRVDVKTLARDDCCALGKWIHADGQRLRGRASFTALVEQHARFHRVAGQVGELINKGEYVRAEQALGHGSPFSSATIDVVRVLSAAKRLGFE